MARRGFPAAPCGTHSRKTGLVALKMAANTGWMSVASQMGSATAVVLTDSRKCVTSPITVTVDGGTELRFQLDGMPSGCFLADGAAAGRPPRSVRTSRASQRRSTQPAWRRRPRRFSPRSRDRSRSSGNPSASGTPESSRKQLGSRVLPHCDTVSEPVRTNATDREIA
jgi:hypothetical protein